MMKKKMKKTVAIISAALVLGTFQIADLSTEAYAGQPSAPVDKYPAAILSDIEGHWAADSIRGAVQAGYVDGYEDGTFRPDHDVSRAEFIKLVSVAVGEKVTPVDGDFWYRPYIVALKEDGILPDDFYETNINIPMVRSEMAMIAMRAVDKNAQGTMLEATEKGLIQGVGNGDLDAKGKTTRAQSVTIINRILDARKGKELEVDKQAVENAEIETKGTNLDSVLGVKTNLNLPVTYDLISGVKLTVEEIIMFDADDKSSPYQYLIDGVKVNLNKSIDGKYVIGYKAKLEIDTPPSESIRIKDYFNMQSWDSVGGSSYTLASVDPSSTTGEEGYILFALDKGLFKERYNGEWITNIRYSVGGKSYSLVAK